MHFSLSEANLETGTTAGTYVTLMGLKAANTAGHRSRLRRIFASGARVAPQDIQVSIRIAVTDNTTDGTSTDSSSDVAKKDPNSVATRMSAVGTAYTVEPTTVDRVICEGAFNGRGQLSFQWLDPDEMPVWGPDETLVIQGTIGSGSTAATLSLEGEWEEF